ncbi:MAG: cytochrome c [Rhodoferax sp.]|nr:cytochrome c [Rhodoferax sp.]
MAVGNGAQLYQQHCANCPGLQGQGQPGAYPALIGNRMVLLDHRNNPILSVMQGGFAPAPAGNPRPYGMPPFMLRLTVTELAQALSHERTSWATRPRRCWS